MGGKPDVDYVRFVIKPNKSKATLALWFGPMALSREPDKDIVKTSDYFSQTNLLDLDGAPIGLDTLGQKRDRTRWRHFTIPGKGGAVYTEVLISDSALFDTIIESACLVPFPQN